jgi:ABC-type uncharacterized transport system substrate-binding protein
MSFCSIYDLSNSNTDGKAQAAQRATTRIPVAFAGPVDALGLGLVKILKGAKPAEIPVEVNSKIEFSINLKAATATGLTIAPEVLYQADRLIR